MQGTTGLRLNSNAELKARSLKAAATKPEASVAATFRSRDGKATKISQYLGIDPVDFVKGVGYIPW